MTGRATLRWPVLAALLGSAFLALVGCGAPDLERLREQRLSRAAQAVAAVLEDAASRARAALREAGPEVERAQGDLGRRFAALEGVRERHGVDGLVWSDPGGRTVWAGIPVEPRDVGDVPPPWQGSFASGDLVFHAPPFGRALIARGSEVGDAVQATVRLPHDARGGDTLSRHVEEEWADRYGVKAIRILPPAVLGQPAAPHTRRLGACADAKGAPLLAIEVESRDEASLAHEIGAVQRHARGGLAVVGLLLAAAAALLGARRLAPRLGGGPATALLVSVALLLRHGLLLLDLPGRFTSLARLFDPTDFGVTGWLGWLASPGDLLLTSAALLAAAWAIARWGHGAPSHPGLVRKALGTLLGLALALLAARGWPMLIEGVPAHGQLDLLAPGPLEPSLPAAVLLAALLLATVAAWLLVRAALRRTIAACPTAPWWASGLAVALLLALGAWRGADAVLPAWTNFVLPGAALLAGRLAPGSRRPPVPTRLLLLSVLATILLAPVLMVAEQRAARQDLESRVVALVRRAETARSLLQLRLAPLAEDPVVASALEAYAAGGPAPVWLPLAIWQRLNDDPSRGDEGTVTVYDARERRIAPRFGLNLPTGRRMPDPRAVVPDGEAPVAVGTYRGDADHAAVVAGRVRIASPEGTPLGTVRVAALDPLWARLAGEPTPLGAAPWAADAEEGGARPIDLALVREGRVVMSTDVDMPREGALPADVEQAAAPAWRAATDGEGPWFVVPAGDDRGTVLARPHDLSIEDRVLGLARVCVVGVGLGAALAFLALLLRMRRFRWRLRDKFLWAYVAITAIPLLSLGWAHWRDTLARAEEEFQDRLESTVRSAQREIESVLGTELDIMSGSLGNYAELRRQDLTVYVGGVSFVSSLEPLVDAEILPRWLDASVYRATELEGRDVVVREEPFAGRRVRVAYAPLRSSDGAPVATLAAPLVFDSERAERRAAEGGSMLVAAYLLALVLIVLVGLWTARGLARPIDRLVEGTRRVAAGETDVVIPGAGRDEIGGLVEAFNAMTTDLRSTRERAARAEREGAWRGMARQVAHEIKNPLTPMKLMLQQLQATARTDPRFAAELIEPTAKVVLEQIDALSRIASDFSAFARFPPRALRDVDLNALLRGVAILYGAAGEPGVSISTDLAPDLPPVHWDEDELRRVFVNLVANAVQARDEARAELRVRILSRPAPHATSGGPGVEVVVEDDGVGISPEHQGRLFEPDFSTKTHGTGLGLAIVRRILTDLGGEIRIESLPGRGTRVLAWLPAATSAGSPLGTQG